MSTVTPPPPPVPAAPISGLVANTALVLSAPPQTLQALQALQAGQSIQGTFSAQPAANQIQVQTAIGLLTLQTTMTIPRGAVLTLVRSPAPSSPPAGGQPAPVAFQISTINGKPVTGGAVPLAPSPPHPATSQSAAAQAAPPPLAAGQTVTATLLRPAPGVATATGPGTTTAPAPAAPASGQPGGAVTPSPQASGPANTPPAQHGTPAPSPGAVATPAASTRPSNAPTPSAQPSSAAPSSTSATATGSHAPTTTLPSGTRFSATVQRIEAPNAAVTTPGTVAGAKALAPGQVLVGTVTGRTAGGQPGQPIVQTPIATFALGSSAATSAGALVEGTKITFRLDSAPLAPTTKAPGAALRALDASHGLINAKTWDDLSEAFKALAGADPSRLLQVAQHALPQPGAKLSSQMLFFLSALKGGDLRSLFGDSALRVIDKERPNLLSRLGSDFQTMSRLAEEPQQGDWRLALIPLWNGEKLEQLRFFWRGSSNEEGGEEAEDTRFVFDLDFSNFGHMQIDGLVKGKRRHVDLILRTDQPLPPDMRADIGAIYEEARDTLGLSGQVAFQAAPGNFIAVPNAAATAGSEPGSGSATGLNTKTKAVRGTELPNLLA